ncbi:hypothetical protein [Mycobacterium sp. smrl_JER01]|uniref:hypothetical protein n=1 Tax=Mycobacterium sp. smrl_JER01 TaxID=3402633 RepID=UPI003D73A650
MLQEIAVTARQQAAELVERHATDLIRGLAQQLEKVRVAAAKAVDQLGAGVNDPVSAINADVAEHWKTLVGLRGEYDAIRSAQKTVYLYTGEGMFDQLRCGDNQHLINDPEARLYFHRNLTTVAPRWRGGIDTDRREHVGEVPWPDDAVERLVWFIRNDSGIWCPTRGEIKTLLAEGGAGPDPKNRGAQVPRLAERGHATKEGAKPDLWNTPVEMLR